MVVVLVAVAIAASVTALRGSSAGGVPAQDPTIAVVAPTARIDDVAAPASDVDRRVVEAVAPVPAEITAAFVPAPHAAISADSIWIEGRVEFPPGMPRDERVYVAVTEPPISDAYMEESLGEFLVGADGRFRIPVPSNTWNVELELDARSLLLVRPRTVDLLKPERDVVLRPLLAAVLRVRFVPSAAMLARGFEPNLSTASVEVPGQFLDFRRRKRSAMRDDAGVVEVGSIRPGIAHTLRAHADGALPHEAELPPFRAGEVREIEIALTAAPRIAGTVRDERGAPVGGARLRLETKAPVPVRQPGYATSDADGRFVIHAMAEGEARLHVECEGFVAAELGPWTMNLGLELADFPVVLSHGATITGRVRWPDGSAAAGVWLAVVPAGADSLEAPFPPDHVGTPARTDADGSFRIPGLDAGPRTLTALVCERLDRSNRKSERVVWTARTANLRLPASDVELVLSSGSTVRGRVVDDLGEPVADANVVASPTAQRYDDSGRSATADANGRFELAHMRDGAWRVVACRPSASGSAPATFVVTAPDVPELVVVVPRAARLAGRVLDASGAPAHGAEVYVEVPDTSTTGRSWLRRAITAVDGTFLAEGLPPGALRVSARKFGCARSLEVDVVLIPTELTAGLELRLRGTGTVDGVLLAADGTPIPSDEIELHRDDVSYPVGRARTDELGQFRFEHVEPGTVWLFRPRSWSDSIDGPGRLVVEEGATMSIVLRGR